MLNKLQAEKLKLQSLILQLDEDISTSKEQLTASFTSGDNSDKLSLKVSQLEAKYNGLLNAVDLNAKSIDTETQRLIDEDKQTDLDQRKSHVLSALKSLDRAVKLQGELLVELQNVTTHNDKALFRNNSQIHKSIRGLVGRLAAEFNLHGSLQMSSTIPIPTVEDYDALITHINEF
jgi:myosin heavy subunit